MRRFFFLLTIFLCPTFVVAQFDIPSNPGGGNLGNINTGNTGTGSTRPGGSGTGGSSQAPSTGMSNDPTALTSTADTPTFQGFQNLGGSSFIGVPGTSTFVGTEQSFDQRTTTSSRRQTTATATRRTTTTASRTMANRTSTMNRNTRSTNNPQSVRSTASSEFAFSPMEVGDRTAAIQTRITRLPNFRTVPEQITVRMEGDIITLTGTAATPYDRKLAEQLVRLEPGVGTVDNQITVKKE